MMQFTCSPDVGRSWTYLASKAALDDMQQVLDITPDLRLKIHQLRRFDVEEEEAVEGISTDPHLWFAMPLTYEYMSESMSNNS